MSSINHLLAVESSQIYSFVILGVLVVFLVVLFFLQYRRRKKQDQETKDIMDSLQPGNKVKTIGGVCGIVVAVDNEEKTFILETGSEETGKCFIKFDKQAIFQTDAKLDKKEEAEEEEPVEEPFEETKAEVKAEPAPAEDKAEEEEAKD